MAHGATRVRIAVQQIFTESYIANDFRPSVDERRNKNLYHREAHQIPEMMQ